MQPAVRVTETQPEDEPVPGPERAVMPYPLLLDVSSLKLTDRQLERIFSDNGNLQFELTAKEELIIMAPSGESVAEMEAELAGQVRDWAKENGTGITYGTSGGFRMSNGALYAPDVSWFNRERRDAWREEQAALPQGQRRSFPGLCPDFVLELRSPNDTVANVQRKMEEYIENGARLGWLIDPINRQVHVYRPGEPVQTLENPEAVSGDPVLPGFVLNLVEIW